MRSTSAFAPTLWTEPHCLSVSPPKSQALSPAILFTPEGSEQEGVYILPIGQDEQIRQIRLPDPREDQLQDSQNANILTDLKLGPSSAGTYKPNGQSRAKAWNGPLLRQYRAQIMPKESCCTTHADRVEWPGNFIAKPAGTVILGRFTPTSGSFAGV